MKEILVKKQRTLIGEVVSNRMDKTVIVSIIRKVPHPKYGKYIKRRTKLFVHDQENTANIREKALIGSNRPISKNKHWVLLKILK